MDRSHHTSLHFTIAQTGEEGLVDADPSWNTLVPRPAQPLAPHTLPVAGGGVVEAVGVAGVVQGVASQALLPGLDKPRREIY